MREDLPREQPSDELREIACGRHESAAAEGVERRVPAKRVERVEVLMCPRWLAGGCVLPVLKMGGAQAQRREDEPPVGVGETAACDVLDDEPEQDITGVGVSEPGARKEVRVAARQGLVNEPERGPRPVRMA